MLFSYLILHNPLHGFAVLSPLLIPDCFPLYHFLPIHHSSSIHISKEPPGAACARPHLSPLPRSSDTAKAQVTNHAIERRRREIEVVLGASGAAVDDGDHLGAALVVDADLAAAGVLAVVERGRDGGDELAVVVGLTAGAEAGVVPGDGAGAVDGGASVGLGGSGGGGEGHGDGGEGSESEGDHFV